MFKGRISRVFDLEPEGRGSSANARGSSGQLCLPTLDERAKLYLHAVHGKRDFTNQEYSDARDMILDAMAADLAARSGWHKITLPKGTPKPPRLPIGMENVQPTWVGSAESTPARFENPVEFSVPRLDQRRVVLAQSLGPARSVAVARALDQSQESVASPVRRLTTRSTFIWAAAAAASVALLLFLLPIFWFATDQNSTGPQMATPEIGPHSPARTQTVETPLIEQLTPPEQRTQTAETPLIEQLTPEQIAEVVTRGQQLFATGQFAPARLLLERVAMRDATAALALGTTYDPIELRKLGAVSPSITTPVFATPTVSSRRSGIDDSIPDIARARLWYRVAKDLGSVEAVGRLESLGRREREPSEPR